jgi:tRNA A-37 threonylcarbamoyl transferase component Bud32
MHSGKPQFERFFHDPAGCTVIRQDRHKVLLRCDGEPGTDGPLCVKIYRCSGPAQSIRETLSGSRAARDLHVCRQLAARDIAVPEPLGAVTDRTSWGGVRRSIFATRWVSDMESLRDIAVPLAKETGKKAPLIASLCTALGHFIATLHGRGIYSSDLNEGNLMIRRHPDGIHRVLLVDFEGVRFLRTISRKRRLANLAPVTAFLLPLGPEIPGLLCAAYAAAVGSAPDDLLPAVRERAMAILARRKQELDARFTQIGQLREKALSE